jgi:hypothetical protein
LNLEDSSKEDTTDEGYLNTEEEKEKEGAVNISSYSSIGSSTTTTRDNIVIEGY